jgi:hypothetical protein
VEVFHMFGELVVELVVLDEGGDEGVAIMTNETNDGTNAFINALSVGLYM